MKQTWTYRALVLSVLIVSAGFSQAAIVSGYVRNEGGAGIPTVDLDFYDTNQGQFILTLNDDTDFSGHYSVSVPVSEYDIYYNPPTGSPYLTHMVHSVVTGDMAIDVTLLTANYVTGYVTDLAGVPVYNVDLDCFDAATGDEVLSQLPNDNTDVNGFYQVLIPDGTYDIRFTPALGDTHAAAELLGVLVDTSVVLDTVRLEPGLAVSGTVVDPSLSPVSNVDLNFVDAGTGITLYTPRDNSDGNGVFSVLVPDGLYDIIFRPPTGSGLAYAARYGVPVASDTSLGTIPLRTGFTVSGVVTDPGSQPVAGADLDMIDLTTGFDIPTDNDRTDLSGAFQMLAPPETMDVVVKPPVGASLAAAVLRNRVIAGNTNLGTIQLVAGFSISGFVRNIHGVGLEGADIDLVEIGSGLKYPTPGDDADSTGHYLVRAPAGSYLVIANPPLGQPYYPDTVVVNPLTGNVVIDFVLISPLSGVESGVPPTASVLRPNAPNPFNPATEIRFSLSGGDRQKVSLLVFSSSGRVVRTLLSGTFAAGDYAVRWDGRNDAGESVSSGVYLCVLETESGRETRKMTLVR
jgi:hypothetical protein